MNSTKLAAHKKFGSFPMMGGCRFEIYIDIFYISVGSISECFARIANRVRRGGHKNSEDDVTRCFEKCWESVSKVLPYCNEAEFYDNDNGFIKVAEYKNCELHVIGGIKPIWPSELQAYLKNNM